MTQETLSLPYLEYLERSFPKSFPIIKEKNLINPNLFSPFILEMPSSLLEQVQEFVSEVYKVKESESYQNSLPKDKALTKSPQTPSVLSCFDFHYTEDMGLKLIEINTNASLYIPILLHSCSQGKGCTDHDFEILHQSFVNAFDLKKGDAISILDADPEKEGLYFEFLLFKEWFERLGYKANIISLESYAKEKAPKVYNRFTDFFFREEASQLLNEDYYNQSIKFSPNPREYFLMADKHRLMDLRRELEKSSEKLASMIPQSFLFSEFESKEDLWSQRKKFFFKPSQSFGSKAVYSGKGISKKAFENIYSPDFMAQELCPAGKKKFTYKDQEVEMKFDLRFFTFNGKVQNYGARIYQGQATNMRTPLGGITPICFS